MGKKLARHTVQCLQHVQAAKELWRRMVRKEWSSVLQYAHLRHSRLMICMVRILPPLSLLVSYARADLGVLTNSPKLFR